MIAWRWINGSMSWLVLAVGNSSRMHQRNTWACVDAVTLQSCLRSSRPSWVMWHVLHRASQLGHVVKWRSGYMLPLAPASCVVNLSARIHAITIAWVYACQLVAERDHLLMLRRLPTVRLVDCRCAWFESLLVHLLLLSIIEVVRQASLLLLTLYLATHITSLETLRIAGILIWIGHLVLMLTLLGTISNLHVVRVMHLLHLILLILSVFGLVRIHALIWIYVGLVLVMHRLWSDCSARILSPIGIHRLVCGIQIPWMRLCWSSLIRISDSCRLALISSFALAWWGYLTCTHSLAVSASLTIWNLLLWTTALSHRRICITLHLLNLPRSKIHWVIATTPSEVSSYIFKVHLLHIIKLSHAHCILSFTGVLSTSVSSLTALWIWSLLNLSRFLCIHCVLQVFVLS